MSSVLTKTEVDTLTPIQRLETLCDAGSLDVIRSEVVSSHMGLKARAGDGVVGGAGLVDGRPVFCYAQDNSYVGGSLGAPSPCSPRTPRSPAARSARRTPRRSCA